MANQKDRVKFNVGGKTFETTATTFAVAGRNSFFGALFDENWNLQPDQSNEYFINRDPDCFGVLLNLLRTGELCTPHHIPEKLLYREAMFYGLLDHVRSAKWGPFDGNRLCLSQSIKNYAAADGTVIRASPHGGCCVAHSNVVHVYDWMLEEHPPVNLDFQKVNDVGWIDEETFVVGASERQGGGGGMGLFSASTGELRHRFQVTCWDQLKGYTAGALCSSSDKIFSSCKSGKDIKNGICVWDQVTGKLIDCYEEAPGSLLDRSLGNADRLQWLHSTNCLMVASLSKKEKDYSLISLWDVRVKKMVWNWPDSFQYSNGSWIQYSDSSMKTVRDVIAMEEVNSICAVNQYEEFGFLDLRSSREVRSVMGLRTFNMCNKSKVKLALHDNQLFLLTHGRISVFCGPDWEPTSRLPRPDTAPICDISLGGDRLFALHEASNSLGFFHVDLLFFIFVSLVMVEDGIAYDAFRVAKISTTSWNSLSSKLFQFLVNVVLLNEELIKCICYFKWENLPTKRGKHQRPLFPIKRTTIVRAVAVPVAPSPAEILPSPAESAEYRIQLSKTYGFRQIGEPLPDNVTLKDIIGTLPKKVIPLELVNHYDALGMAIDCLPDGDHGMDQILVNAMVGLSLLGYMGTVSVSGQVVKKMSTFTMVHHTAPHIPFKHSDEWNAARAQLNGTVHCDYPRWIETLCHDINVHIPHHISPRIPSYNLRAAHQSLRDNWGKYLNEATWNWRLMKTILTVCHVYNKEQNYIPFDEIAPKESYPITFLKKVMPDSA
ncbi:hypothetical protein RHGRI_000264 [Rhododendron griersonianum]|uniref:BTB domain-containing protein n=1 Tax=Rhododendron griersonianum TaxID=479676 RepID=A0AAV6LFX5_9ERIC|nr:hypothetical protein RHGRI_000264 [Rhododendron griersonianum]